MPVVIPEDSPIRVYFTQRLIDTNPAGWVRDVVLLASEGNLGPTGFQDAIAQHGLTKEQGLRKAALDLILDFIAWALERGTMTPGVLKQVDELKRFMDVREGEFFAFRPVEVATLLTSQLDRILQDLTIDGAEDLYQVELQAAFDLGYDQYFALTRRAFEAAMEDWRLQFERAIEGRDTAAVIILERKGRALEPVVNLALAQPRSLGALY
ncbi:MAG: hypothetical protein M3O61_14855 [Gemmatimonadota bacterium]|nr:hypothetical protein [Gemmatimonadota bacterium]